MREIVSEQFLQGKPWGPIPKAPKGHTWESLMTIALEMAGLGACKGEIPVGAVVCDREGNILAKAHNQSIADSDPTAHAEIIAMRQAGKKLGNYRLLDCVLVVTLEPCTMCMGAIREARLQGVVFGAYDKRAGAISSLREGLDCAELGVRTWHYGGLMAEKSISLLQEFFKNKR